MDQGPIGLLVKVDMLYTAMSANRWVLFCSGLALTMFASQATSAQQATVPSKEEARAIATEGFIYGLPIVMNYAVMYQYSVDRSSGQFKAPFNEIHNEARVFTYKDTAVVTPNSDTPYSMLMLLTTAFEDEDENAKRHTRSGWWECKEETLAASAAVRSDW